MRILVQDFQGTVLGTAIYNDQLNVLVRLLHNAFQRMPDVCDAVIDDYAYRYLWRYFRRGAVRLIRSSAHLCCPPLIISSMCISRSAAHAHSRGAVKNSVHLQRLPRDRIRKYRHESPQGKALRLKTCYHFPPQMLAFV